MDTITVEARSLLMSRIRGKDTLPERIVRSLVHRMGFRFRLHVDYLPGRPDLVFPSRGKVIFVHGCFWHAHANCTHARLPKSNIDFWTNKLESNRRRDRQVKRLLTRTGWRYLVVWECELGNLERISQELRAFLEDRHAGT
ncbi:MAG: very short patch repair endonuclease [Planctomyces sp.]|nr:very short patch repair endonuclease [Planctomyces sp.]